MTDRPKSTTPEPEFEPDGPCVEADGCPTEMAVLKRFWREQQVKKVVDTEGKAEQLAETTLAILKAAKDIPDGLYARARNLATTLFAESEYRLTAYERGQWWTKELTLLAEGGAFTHDSLRACGVARDFIKVVFDELQVKTPQAGVWKAAATAAQAERDHFKSLLVTVARETQEAYDAGNLPKGHRYWWERFSKEMVKGQHDNPSIKQLLALTHRMNELSDAVAGLSHRDKVESGTSDEASHLYELILDEAHMLAMATTFPEIDFDIWLQQELGLSTRRLPNGDYQSFGAACAAKAWWAGPKTYKPGA